MDSETFLGSALNAVDAKGRLSVPAFIRTQLDRTSDARIVLIGVHETKPCLTVYGTSYAEHMLADYERRLRGAEERGEDLDDMDDRATGIFANTERVPYDSSGRIVLSRPLRDHAGIGDLALFVGKHRFVEMWSPTLALEHGRDRLKTLAANKLKERGVES